MPYTVTELVTRSWYLSGIVSRDLETVSGDQLSDGVQMLNSLLAIKTANQRLIPYYKAYEFNAVIGQEMYFIPDLVLTESLTFNLDTVRYSLIPTDRVQYFSTPRANGIQSLPYQYHLERAYLGSNLYMYFLPQAAYPFTLWGKFSLMDVTLNQDLSLTLDQFYIEYLRYGLAEYMCQEYNIVYQPQNEKRLMELENMIFDISPIDMTMRKMSSLQKRSSLNYADINIGRGWRP